MKPTLKKRRIQRMCVLVLMLIFTVITFAYNSSSKSNKSKKEQLNEEFRNIAEEMRDAYENGDLNKVIDLYTKKCCKDYDKAGKGKAKAGVENKRFKKVTKEIRASIYQWVLLSYTALDRPDLGDIFLKKLLILRRAQGTGDYWLSIRNAANTRYYVAPRLLVGLNAGINFTLVEPGDRYSILEASYETQGNPYQKDYDFHFKHSRGTQLGVIAEYALTKNFSINIQPTLSTLKFQYIDTIEWEIDKSGEPSGTPITMEFIRRHRLSYMELPVLLKYQFGKGKLKPYLQIGGFFRIITSAYKKLYKIHTETVQADPFIDFSTGEKFLEEIPIKEKITRTNGGLLVGAGIGRDIRGLRLSIEVNYKYGLNNIVNEENRWGDMNITLGHYDVFDDMKIRNWDLSVKVLLPISFKAFRR